MADEPPQEHRIVVGVDASPPSKRALNWALRQARCTGAVVEAVLCWSHPAVFGGSMTKADPVLDHAAEEALAQTVAEAVADDPKAEVRQSVVPGNAAEILLERARGADLLVLGHRGHGGFQGALLGSVGQHCVQHAPCPVVVVRGDN
ncbi:universal stress protein [Streptomyces gamaensis]|uniref:Universal stress protein n=1 Tax=Streptomyces gamaensis TaxID=1763542 RepID=A0ABW0Z6P5_9ACTN